MYLSLFHIPLQFIDINKDGWRRSCGITFVSKRQAAQSLHSSAIIYDILPLFNNIKYLIKIQITGDINIWTYISVLLTT